MTRALRSAFRRTTILPLRKQLRGDPPTDRTTLVAAGAKLVEVGEHEERLRALEAVLARQRSDEAVPNFVDDLP